MGHAHSVIDKDTHFIIDPVTRAITNENTDKLSIMQYDHNSERLTFEMPRYIEGHDMSLCNKVEVHFLNIDSKTKDQTSGKRDLEDFRVSEDDESKVVVSWLITKGSTKLGGKLNFLLNFRCMDGDIETYAWHTDFFTDFSVKSGLDASELFESEYVDVIEQWKASVMQHFTDDLNTWKEAAKAEVKSAVSQEVAVERARIDQIVALKEGSTTGDAELQDIRVGVSGETYQTAGKAVRSQIQFLLDDLGVFKTTFSPDLELGTLSEGIIGYSINRARMTETHRAYRTIVKCGTNSDYMFGYVVYDETGAYDEVDHGWNTFNGNSIVFEGCYFRMNFRRTDNAEISESDIATLRSLVTISDMSGKNDIEELKKSVYEGEEITASFELELGSIANGESVPFTTRARFVDKVKVSPKTVMVITPNYNYVYGYAFYDEGGVYDGVDNGWIYTTNSSIVTFSKNGYVRFNFRRIDDGEITETDLVTIKSYVKITDRKNNYDILKYMDKVDEYNDAISSINIEHGRAKGASYVFAKIPKSTNRGRRVVPKIRITSTDGSISGDKVSTLTYSKRNRLVFTINAGLFDTSTMQPVGQTIIDGISIINTPMTDDNGYPISDSECYPLCIDENGDLSAPYARSVDTSEMISDGVIQAVTGWGKVIENFEPCSDTVENEIVHGGTYIRQCIGQFQNGDYFVCTVDQSRGSVENEAGITYSDLAQLLMDKGVKFAYSLDGGGSAETVIGERQLNPIYEGEFGRAVPTVIMFEIQ